MHLSVLERQLALQASYPTWLPDTLHGMLERVAARWPDREFVVYGDTSLTYAEVLKCARCFAEGLVSAGAKPGDNIALLMANFPEFVALKFAISIVGATAIPLNFLNKQQELAYLLEQSDARFLITMDRFRDLDYLAMLDHIVPGWPEDGGGSVLPELKEVFVLPVTGQALPPAVTPVNHLALSRLSGTFPEIDPNNISDIIYTSGTTGGPKGVLLSHDMLLRTAYGSAYARAFSDGQRIQFALPMYHVYGYVEGLLAALIVGGAIIIETQFDPRAFLASMARNRAEDLLLIPTMTLALIEQARIECPDISSLRSVLSSGGKAPRDIWEKIWSTFGDVEITTGYGMSEATASSTVTRPDDPLERLLETNGRLRDVGVAGDPGLENRLIDYRVVDPDTGVALPFGEVGELRMKGPGVTSGYYKKPVETHAAFDAEGWFCTGDLGTIDEQGYISLKGRTKESYRCGGELVLPLEVEQVLAEHERIAEVHVVPVPDVRMGEVGVACVVPADGLPVDPDAIIAFARSRLARFKVPQHVICLSADEIPVTATGRARKFLLIDRVQQRLAAQMDANQ